MRIDLIGKRHPLSPTDFGPLAVLPAAVGAFGGGGLFSALALGGTALSGGVSAYGAYQQGQAQKNMLKYQSEAAATQQKIAKQTADANITGVQTEAAMKSGMLSRQQATVKGAQAAQAGAQGIGGSVTGVDIAKDTFTKQQMDQMTLQYNANVKSWGITNRMNAELWGLGTQEEQYSMGAENAGRAGTISAAGSLLNTASQIGTEAYFFNR